MTSPKQTKSFDPTKPVSKFYSDGTYFPSPSNYDLINTPQKKQGWIAVEFFATVRRGKPIGSASLIYATQDEANDASARVFSTRSQIIRIEVEEP